MGRYFCDYCDAYLTHDSEAGRQQHNRGWRHRENFRSHYKRLYPGFAARQQQHQLPFTGQPQLPFPGQPQQQSMPGFPQQALPMYANVLPPPNHQMPPG